MFDSGQTSTRWLLLAAAAASLLGCSGASNGSADVSLSSNSISFEEYEGEAYSGGSVTVTLLNAPGNVYATLATSATNIVEPFFVVEASTRAKAGVIPLATLEPGTYSGTATVMVCRDAACATVLTRKPLTFSFTILKGFSVAPAALTYDLDSMTPDVVVSHPLDIFLPAPGTVDQWWLDSFGEQLFLTAIDASHSGVAMTSYFKRPGTNQRVARFSYRRSGGPSAAVTRDVVFTVNVAPPPGLLVTPSRLSFEAVANGPAPAPQSLTLTGEGGVTLAYQTLMSSGALSWLAVNGGASATTPGSATVSVTRTDLAPGTYLGQAIFEPTTYLYASLVPVDVSYRIHPLSLTVAPASVAFTAGPGTTPSQLSAAVNLSDAGTPLAWTASATSNWLQLSPANGLTGVGSLTLSVPASALDGLSNGIHQDVVTLRYQEPTGGWFQVELPVSLEVAVPRVAWVTPRAEVSGLSAEVVLYGDRLDLLGPVTFDGAPATATTVVSPKELIVAHGPLAAGDVMVGSTSLPGLGRTTTTLKVVDPRDRPPEAMAGMRPFSLAFDDANETLYTVNGTLLSRRAADGTWTTGPTSWQGTGDLVLAPDGALHGTGCRAGQGCTGLIAFDLNSLAGTVGPLLDGGSLTWHQVYGVDGLALLLPRSGSGWRCMTYTEGADAPQPFPSAAHCSEVTSMVASDDGRRVVFGGVPSGAIEYEPATGAFQQTSSWGPGKVLAIDRTGSRVLVSSGLVYDRSWSTVAFLPVLGWAAALTPDGRKGVVWDQYSPIGKGAMRVYDISLGPGSTPELGPEGGTAPPVDIGAVTSIVVSADGQTAFLRGGDGYAILPIP